MLSYTSRKCWKKIPRILGSSESESELPRTNFKLVIFLFTSCSDIVMRSALTANFMYCRPWVPATIYFINKVLFYQYMRNGSRVMMQCLCYIKTYFNAQYSLFRTEINFYLTPESNTIFCPSLITI